MLPQCSDSIIWFPIMPHPCCSVKNDENTDVVASFRMSLLFCDLIGPAGLLDNFSSKVRRFPSFCQILMEALIMGLPCKQTTVIFFFQPHQHSKHPWRHSHNEEKWKSPNQENSFLLLLFLKISLHPRFNFYSFALRTDCLTSTYFEIVQFSTSSTN